MTTDAILAFRDDLSRYRDFCLHCSDPVSSLDVCAHFTRGAVQVSGTPYVVLQSDQAEVCIKHIAGVSVRRKPNSCVYRFLCRDCFTQNTRTYLLVCSGPSGRNAGSACFQPA